MYKHSLDNAVESPEPGYAKQETTWEKTASALNAVDDLDDESLGLGVTAQGDGVWAIDEDGEPIRPAILWSDGRVTEQLDRWVEAGADEEIYDICGCGIFAGSSVTILE